MPEEGRVEVKFGDSGQQTEISRVLQQKSFRPMARLNINPLKHSGNYVPHALTIKNIYFDPEVYFSVSRDCHH